MVEFEKFQLQNGLRVIVHQDNCRGRLFHRPVEDLSRMDDTLVQGSLGDLLLKDDPVLAVKQQRYKVLPATVTESVVEMVEYL